MLKLEKENQSLLKIIEELRAFAHNSSTQTKRSHHLVCTTHNFTSSPEESSVLQTSSSILQNHTDAPPLSALTQQTSNGDSNCHQQLHTEELEGVQSEILRTENADLNMQEKGQLEDLGSGEHTKEIMSDLNVFEKNQSKLHSVVGLHDHSPRSKRSSPCHESILSGLPAHSSYASKHTQRLEAKCRTLDTVNQQLQISLETSGRF